MMSRTVNGEKWFGAREKEYLRKLIRQVAAFSGIRVITYALMDNRFHVPAEVPPERVVPYDEIVRCRCRYLTQGDIIGCAEFLREATRPLQPHRKRPIRPQLPAPVVAPFNRHKRQRSWNRGRRQPPQFSRALELLGIPSRRG